MSDQDPNLVDVVLSVPENAGRDQIAQSGITRSEARAWIASQEGNPLGPSNYKIIEHIEDK